MGKNILIVAGEASGDALGGPLTREIISNKSDVKLWGFGGKEMRDAGVEILTDVSELSVMGFVEVLRYLPKMLKMLDFLVEEAVRRRADGAVLIDYPGFNLRLAQRLAKRGIKVVYYVSPQLWAWKPSRIEAIKKSVSRMIVILPFEEEIYRNAGVPVTFVGHPFLENVIPKIPPDEFRRKNGLSEPVLLLLPGSREQEVKRLLSPMLGAYEILRKKIPSLNGVVARAENLPEKLFDRVAEQGVKLISGNAINAMFASSAGLVCSGSATLQCAVAGLPHAITYKTGILSEVIYRRLIRTKFVGLSNLVAGKGIAPELLLRDAVPEKLADAVYPFLSDENIRSEKFAEFEIIRKKLGSPGAAKKAALAVIETLY